MSDDTQPIPQVQPKAGWQTTEFWRTLFMDAAGIGLVVYGAVKANDTALIAGGALAGLSTGGYALGRGLAKS